MNYDWSKVPEHISINYLAQDENGRVFGYTEKPKLALDNGLFFPSKGGYIEIDYESVKKTYIVDWSNSLEARPGLFNEEPDINIENLEPNHVIEGFLCEECGLYAIEKGESGEMILDFDAD